MFGSQTTSQAPAFGTTFGFGSNPTSTGTGFSASTSTAAPTGFAFGSNVSSSATPASRPTVSFGLPATTSVASAPFSFSTPAASVGATATTSSGFTFGTPATPATSTPAAGLGGFGSTSTTGQLTLGNTFGAPQSSTASATPAPSTFKGLGGTAQPGQSDSGASSQSGTNPKEAMIPPEFQANVEELKKHIENQKKKRDEIMKFSSAPIHRVSDDIAALHARIVAISQCMATAAVESKRLKDDVLTELRNVEIGQKTREIASGLQYENTAPTEYFARSLQNFTVQVEEYNEQIRALEKHMAATQGSKSVSVRDLQNFLNRLYSTLVRLAGESNAAHLRVEAAKSAYGASMLSTTESPNPFAFDRASMSTTHSAIFPEIPTGPSPADFGKSTSMLVSMTDLKNRHHGPPPVTNLISGSVTLGTAPQHTLFPSAGANVSGMNPFGTSGVFNTSQPSGLFGSAPVENKSGFQLQMPPLGNKRGKR